MVAIGMCCVPWEISHDLQAWIQHAYLELTAYIAKTRYDGILLRCIRCRVKVSSNMWYALPWQRVKYVSRRTSGCIAGGEGSLVNVSLILVRKNRQFYLKGVGEYTAVSEAKISASSWGLLGLESPLVLALSVVDSSSLLGECDFFSSFSLFSRPSTLFNKASKTSVFGPRFFGTASICFVSECWRLY